MSNQKNHLIGHRGIQVDKFHSMPHTHDVHWLQITMYKSIFMHMTHSFRDLLRYNNNNNDDDEDVYLNYKRGC
jgi:hypothetical protein